MTSAVSQFEFDQQLMERIQSSILQVIYQATTSSRKCWNDYKFSKNYED